MNHKTSMLLQLRKLMPIGITEGYALLEATDYNVQEAVSLKQADYVKQVISNTIYTEDQAIKLLRHYNFDVARVLDTAYREIEAAYFTETEIILRDHGYNAKSLVEVMAAHIARDKRVEWAWDRRPPVPVAGGATLNEYQQAILTVAVFLDVEEENGAEYALWAWDEYVTKRTEKLLGLENLGSAVRLANKIRQDAYTTVPQNHEGYTAADASLGEDELYIEAVKYYSANRQLLTERLAALIRQHVEEFS